MDATQAIRLDSFITLPRSDEGFVKVTSTTADSVDLQTIGNQDPDFSRQTTKTVGVIDHFVTIQAETGDLFICASDVLAGVTGANAPSATAAGTGQILKGVSTPAAGISYKIPAGEERSFIPTARTRYLGFVASATGKVRIFKTSY